MTTDDSRPDPLPAAGSLWQASEADGLAAPRGARRRLAEMRRDFAAPTFAAILAAFRADLAEVARGLATSNGAALARHGHVLTSLAGELGEDELSARGRLIELDPEPVFAAEAAALIAPLLALLEQEATP